MVFMDATARTTPRAPPVTVTTSTAGAALGSGTSALTRGALGTVRAHGGGTTTTVVANGNARVTTTTAASTTATVTSTTSAAPPFTPAQAIVPAGASRSPASSRLPAVRVENCIAMVMADVSWPRTTQGLVARMPCPPGTLGKTAF